MGVGGGGVVARLPCVKGVKVGDRDWGPCGDYMYGEQCAALLQVLGRAWHAGNAASAIRASLQGMLTGEHLGWEWSDDKHQCGPECSTRKMRETECKQQRHGQ